MLCLFTLYAEPRTSTSGFEVTLRGKNEQTTQSCNMVIIIIKQHLVLGSVVFGLIGESRYVALAALAFGKLPLALSDTVVNVLLGCQRLRIVTKVGSNLLWLDSRIREVANRRPVC